MLIAVIEIAVVIRSIFLGWKVEIIGELCVWTEVGNGIRFVDQGSLHDIK